MTHERKITCPHKTRSEEATSDLQGLASTLPLPHKKNPVKTRDIRSYPSLKPQYMHKGEGGINPAYCDIEHSTRLCLNEKRIWVLRSDGILATGIKNAYPEFKGNTFLHDKLDSSCHQYIDWKNRAGHPSLAVPEGDYDGSVLYAGWLCQRNEFLEVLLFSGRYQNMDLTPSQCKDIEIHITLRFMKAYAIETVKFYNFQDDDCFIAFMQDLPSQTKARTYTSLLCQENIYLEELKETKTSKKTSTPTATLSSLFVDRRALEKQAEKISQTWVDYILGYISYHYQEKLTDFAACAKDNKPEQVEKRQHPEICADDLKTIINNGELTCKKILCFRIKLAEKILIELLKQKAFKLSTDYLPEGLLEEACTEAQLPRQHFLLPHKKSIIYSCRKLDNA